MCWNQKERCLPLTEVPLGNSLIGTCLNGCGFLEAPGAYPTLAGRVRGDIHSSHTITLVLRRKIAVRTNIYEHHVYTYTK